MVPNELPFRHRKTKGMGKVGVLVQLGRTRLSSHSVQRRLDERSYEVDTPEGTYRRNRVHLRRTRETVPPVPSSVAPRGEEYLNQDRIRLKDAM